MVSGDAESTRRGGRGGDLPLLRLVRARLLAHPVAIGALLLDLLLTFTVVAALAAFSIGWISDAGARVVRDAAVADKVVVLTGDYETGEGARSPEVEVEERLASRFDGEVALTGWATGYGLPGSTEAAPRLAQLGYLSRLETTTALARGRYPRPTTSGPVEVAVPEPVAKALGWRVDETVTLADRANAGRTQQVKVVGVYRVTDPGDWTWVGNPYAAEGVSRSGFETYGVLATTRADFERLFARSGTLTMVVTPGPGALRADRVGEASAEAQTVFTDIRQEPYLRQFGATGRLPVVLERAAQAQLATVAALVTPTILLLSVAATGLVLAVALLVSLRRGEVELLRGRGISSRQFVRLGTLEALLLVLPGAVVAAFAGPWLAHAIADLPRSDAKPVVVGVATGATALAAIALLLARTVRLAFSAEVVDRTRRFRPGGLLGGLLSGGLDLAVLALAAVAVLQLRRSAGAHLNLTEPDVLLLLSPTLVLIGASLLTLRLLPWIARLAERSTRRARGLLPAWAAWQTSRRMNQQSGTVLLVTLCTALVVLTTCLSATMSTLAHDQAQFAVGAAARMPVALDRDPAQGLTDITRARVAARDGHLSGVVREEISTDPSNPDTTLLAVDSETFATVAQLRDDMRGSVDLAAAMRALPRTTAFPSLATIPQRATRLTLKGTLPAAGAPRHFDVRAVLRTRTGETVTLGMGTGVPLPDSSGSFPFTAELPLDGTLRERVGDLDLVSLTVLSPLAEGAAPPVKDQIREVSLAVDDAPVKIAQPWTRRSGLLTLQQNMTDPGPLPVLITQAAATERQAHVGSEFGLTTAEGTVAVKVAGVLPGLPTVEGPGIVIDRASLDQAAWRNYLADPSPGRPKTLPLPEELWLDGHAAADSRVADAVSAQLHDGPTLDQEDVARERIGQPQFRSAMTGTWLVAVASLALGLISMVATTFVVGRQRRGELAVLGAMGVGRRTLRWTLVAERVALMALTALVAAGLGLLAATVIAPWMAMNAQVDGAALTARLVIPWPTVIALVGGLVLLLAAIATFTVRSLPRSVVAATLRMGER